MSKLRRWRYLAFPAAGLAVLGALALGVGGQSPGPAAGQQRLRLAYFPNVTHAPAVAGVARGELQRGLPAGVVLDPKVFNAGPAEMEALLAGEVDVGYVGPSPAINTYLKSDGRALRLLAGACSGGAALVARADVGIAGIRDLDGKRVAVPQLGGTQDVSARHFLAQNGLRPREKGGTVEVVPITNPDILSLFVRRQLDAAWVPEPWAARLVKEAGARLVVDERDLWPGRQFTTTVVVVRTAFLEQHAPLVEALLQGHLHSIDWLQQHPDEGQTVVNAELKRLTSKELPAEVLREAWSRVEFTADPNRSSIESFVRAAADAGYLPQQPLDVAGLFHLHPLERARRTLAAAR
ncbi:MAG: ABC transporter substrate-binding protein [Armatimonadetes bacterium]|nr:ABC transporter substrate-binding protein [Armatimonadota bacterium]